MSRFCRITWLLFSLLLLLLCVFYNQGISQASKFNSFYWFSFGYHSIDLTNLNSKLSYHNLPELSNELVTFGAGFMGYIQGNFLVGLEGSLMKDVARSNSSFKANFNAGYGILNIGYNIPVKHSIKFVPVVGIGAGMLSLEIFEKNVDDITNVLNNPRRGSTLKQEALMLNFGLHTFYLLKPYIFGLNIGYTKYGEYRNWHFYDYEIAGSIKSGLTGFYLKFIFGIGMSQN